MMINIAIVLGVSEYVDKNNNLPGCKNDALVINNVIQSTGKYDHILYLNENENSATIKERVVNFITDCKGKVVNELFFYYTGHGEFSNDEFYYILSDFDAKKKNQTSLQNNEMDDLFRTLSPVLVVKVIDACQSGTTYIKEGDVLNKYFNNKKKGFNKCYFLNSSLNNQSSFQSKDISAFTNSFVNAIKQHKATEIRYKDIIDVIVDEFESNPNQTPFFIVQADYTEKFCTINPELKRVLSAFHDKLIVSDSNKIKPSSIYSLVVEDAKNYTDKKGVDDTLLLIKEKISKFNLNDELNQLFKVDVTFLSTYDMIPKKEVLSNWLEKNENDFFAYIVKEDSYDTEFDVEYTIKHGFELNFEVPFKAIEIYVESNFPNLYSYHSNVVFLISKKIIRFFYFITNYKERSWDNKALNSTEVKWVTSEYTITDFNSIDKGVEKIFNHINSRITKDIKEKLSVEPKVEENSSSEDNQANSE